MNKYYSLVKQDNVATLNIYGDITSWPIFECENEMTAKNLSKELEELSDVSRIDVFINSYGGEVAEGLAIYNVLKRHNAKVRTCVDGFACSIASVIFMAGDERIMSESSMLMIHNAWTYAMGNANELRKQAEDLDKITQASVNAYKSRSNLSEEEIKELLDNESWLLPEEALEYGFATKVEQTTTDNKKAAQSVKKQLVDIIAKFRAEAAKAAEDDEDETDDNPEDEPDGDPAPEDDDGEGKEDDESEENPEEEAAQRWSGFFNALMK